jgi:molybdopterin-guanine dinucleotide biosynthesis protein A
MMHSIFGVVLCGGKSTRMGMDKAFLVGPDGIPMWQRMSNLLTEFCEKVFISCRQDQLELFGPDTDMITDLHMDTGPAGAIISLMEFNREMPWLITPCDMPRVGREILEKLIEARDRKADCVVVYNEAKSDIEPLLSLWEPGAYGMVSEMFRAGEFGIRRYISALRTKRVIIGDPELLFNLNTREDLSILAKKMTNED